MGFSFLPENLKLVMGTLVIILMGLSVLARKFPHIGWLQAFNFRDRLTEEQRARLRRSSNRTAGAELILLGIIIPMGFFALEAMFLSTPGTVELSVVASASVLCVALGIVALVRNR